MCMRQEKGDDNFYFSQGGTAESDRSIPGSLGFIYIVSSQVDSCITYMPRDALVLISIQ